MSLCCCCGSGLVLQSSEPSKVPQSRERIVQILRYYASLRSVSAETVTLDETLLAFLREHHYELRLCSCINPQPDRAMVDWDEQTEVTPADDAIPPRRCTVCGLYGLDVPAVHVARGRDGTEWFECDAHSPTDHLYAHRMTRLPIGVWWATRQALKS